MCIICREDADIFSKEEITVCDQATRLPVLNNLKILKCMNNNKLTIIPSMENLELIELNNCSKIEYIKSFPNLEYLYCYDCTSLHGVFNVPKLIRLNCSYCASLMYISHNSIMNINCSHCPLLHLPSNIPDDSDENSVLHEGLNFDDENIDDEYTDDENTEDEEYFEDEYFEVKTITSGVKFDSCQYKNKLLTFQRLSNVECPICIEHKTCIKIKCNHVFCEDCLLSNRLQNKCGLCRRQVVE